MTAVAQPSRGAQRSVLPPVALALAALTVFAARTQASSLFDSIYRFRVFRTPHFIIYFNQGEVKSPPSCPPGMRAFENLVQADRKTRLQNQERLRELAQRRADEVQLICSHDPTELELMQQLER